MKRFAVVSLLLIACFLKPAIANAQMAKDTLTVAPSTLDVRLKQGESSVTIVTITNQYDVPVILQAELQGIDMSSGRLAPSGPITSQLKEAITLSAEDFTVPPQGKYFLTVTIKDTSHLQPGGQYAALVLSDLLSGSQSSGLQPQVTIGMFVVKEQGDIKKVELAKKYLTRKAFQFPTGFSFELINDGNVHLVPRGYVRVYDEKMVYYETVLNVQSQVILPNVRYAQELVLSANPQGILPRKVSFEMGYRADGLDEIKLYREEFWYVPWFIWPIGILGASGVSYFSYWFIRKRIH